MSIEFPIQMTSSFENWLDCLRQLIPINGVVHVGAGVGGAALLYADWAVPAAVFVEANETLATRLSAVISGRSGWTSHTALLSDRDGEADFYLATNPSESGLLPPESLSRFWRNLKTREARPTKTTTLDALLSAGSAEIQLINYAVIDCLPALSVLRGAEDSMAMWDVIIARVVLDEAQLAEQGARKSEVDRCLEARGYLFIASEEENQPALGRALYFRDWKGLFLGSRDEQRAETRILTQARDDLQLLVEQRDLLLGNVTRAHDEHARVSKERLGNIEQLTQERDEKIQSLAEKQESILHLQESVEERQAQIQVLTQEQDELLQIVQQRDILLNTLALERDGYKRLANERLANINSLTQERDQQAQDLAEQEQRVRGLQEVVEERQVEIATLTQERDEFIQVVQKRDVLLNTLELERDRQEQLANQHLARIGALKEQCDHQVQRVAEQQERVLDLQASAEERQVQIQTLTQERDQQARELAEQQERVRDLQASAAELQAQIQTLTQERDQQAQDVAEQQSLLQVLHKSADEWQAQILQLTQARDELAKQLQQRDIRLSEITLSHDEHARVSRERLGYIGALTQERDQQIQLVAEHLDRIRHLQDDADKLNAALAQSTEDVRQARQTANLATKLQSLRQADLDDLQIRYKDALAIQDRQHQLMLQLKEKLRLAARYFHDLTNNTAATGTLSAENTPLAKPARRRGVVKQVANPE